VRLATIATPGGPRLHVRAVRMQGTPAELGARPDFIESFLGGRGDHAHPPGGT
jgi:hypothetical protein